MSDITLTLVAAFGGGLAGAVLQPLASFALDQARAKQDRRKQIERHLRRMVSAQLGYALQLMNEATHLSVLKGLGEPRPANERIEKAFASSSPLPPWEPERIRDDSLRAEATEMFKSLAALALAVMAPNASMEQLDKSVAELSEVRPKIIARMDELDWPEVDG